MSAPKFTPGPWSLEAGRSIVTPSGRFYLGYGSNPKSGDPEFRKFVELDNNAHLCAAAPDLYAALAELVSLVEDADEIVWNRPARPVMEAARNALGKAVGRP